MKNTCDFINLFQANSDKFNSKIALNIINSICINNFDSMTEEYKTEIVSFVNFLQDSNKNLCTSNEDLIIFRLYDQIIKEKTLQIQSDIHSKLTPQQIVTVNKFIKKISSKNTDFNCIVNINNKIHHTTTKDISTFTSLIEYSLYCKNALILFFSEEPNPVTFAFSIQNNSLIEVDVDEKMKNEISSEFPFISKNLTTFSQLNAEIT